MKSNSYYFPHDYHARHDPKLQRVALKYGFEGKGIYWDLIEMLYEQGGYLMLSDISLLSGGDKILCERITSIINDFGLFKTDKTRFWSESCLNRLTFINEKSQKATKSALNRWYGYTDALPTHSEGNAINKIKEKKHTVNREDLRKVINGFIEIKGWDRENPALLTEMYKRHGRAAKGLLQITITPEKAIEAIMWLKDRFLAKGLDWTIETVIKWYPEFTKKVIPQRGDV